jgi:hypothetical protein
MLERGSRDAGMSHAVQLLERALITGGETQGCRSPSDSDHFRLEKDSCRSIHETPRSSRRRIVNMRAIIWETSKRVIPI